MTKLFYDFEFTGLRQHTTPISLGIVASTGQEFYCEFTDYDTEQVDDWIQENVIDKLHLPDKDSLFHHAISLGSSTFVKDTQENVWLVLRDWLQKFKKVEFWGDCSWYDSVLMNELLGGAHNLPDNVDYIYRDIGTMFHVYGIDPDIDREAFINKPIEGDKHNALYDAKVIQECYEKLNRNYEVKYR